jgi:hypothetical protein
MQENRLTVEVNVPVEELFTFTTRPWNTHTWIANISVEECSPWPPQVGVSHYRNKCHNGVWKGYLVTAFDENSLFELTSNDGHLLVRYTYSDLGGGRSTLEYYEAVTDGELTEPFSQDALIKLKHALEDKAL